MFYPTKKLTDLLESCDAGVWGKPAVKGEGLFVLRSTNMGDDGDLDFSDVAELNIKDNIEKIKLFDGDILLEKSGGGPDQPVGRVSYFVAPNHRNFAFANFIQRLRAKPNLVNNRFLFYRLLFLHKTGFTKRLQSQTTGIRNLKLSLYLKTEIPLPPLEIQKQIDERLDRIVTAQKLNDDLVKKTNELFQSLLHQELNPAGKNWGVKKLKEICEINPGKARIVKLPEDRIVSFLAMADVSENAEIVNLQERRSGEVKNGFTFFKDGDVLVAKITPCFENGKGAFIENMQNGIGFGSTEFHVLRANEKVLLNRLLYFIVSDKKFRKAGAKFMTGSAGQQRVPTHYLENFKIPLPPLEIQRQIADKLTAVQKCKAQLLSQKSRLKELFDSVLYNSMT